MINYLKKFVKLRILYFYDLLRINYRNLLTHKISIFDFKNPIHINLKPMKYYSHPNETFHYGHFKVLKHFKSFNKNLICIEHGAHLGMFFFEYYNNSNPNTIFLTLSEKRKQFLLTKLNSKYKVYSIGPYINYVNYSNEFNQILNKFGNNNLIVFPSHSHENVFKNSNTDDFIKYIESIKDSFDRVFICMYWHDILLNKHEIYEKYGYTIVTAGNRNDPNFINRLKSILGIAKSIVTNEYGTYIWYALSQSIPVYFYMQKINESHSNFLGNGDIDNFRNDKIKNSIQVEKSYIINILTESKGSINQEINNLYQEYFGEKIN